MSDGLKTGTCIVAAVQKDGSVLMGADTQATDFDKTYFYEKIFRVNNHLFAMAGRIRNGQLLQFGLSLPSPPPTFDRQQLMGHLVCSVIPCIKNVYKNSIPDSNAYKEEMDLRLLTAINGSIFLIHKDYTVLSFPEGFAADGSGRDAARAVLFEKSKQKKYLTQKDLEAALKAASEYDIFCNDQLTFQTLEAPTIEVVKFGDQ